MNFYPVHEYNSKKTLFNYFIFIYYFLNSDIPIVNFKYTKILLNCMEKSSFRKIFGDSPIVKLLDFLLAERGLFDYTLTDMAENSGVSWTTLNRIFPMFEKLDIVKETRRIGRAKLYTINTNHQLVEKLVKMRNEISDYFIQQELEKQGMLVAMKT
jgi:hypothetical protein